MIATSCTMNCALIFHMTGGRHRTDCPANDRTTQEEVAHMLRRLEAEEDAVRRTRARLAELDPTLSFTPM